MPEAKGSISMFVASRQDGETAGNQRHSGGPHLHGPIFLQQGDDLQKANDSTPGGRP